MVAPGASRTSSLAKPARAVRVWPSVGWGLCVGAGLALVLGAPARWLNGPLQTASGGRLQLAQSEGTVWDGRSTLVLGAGGGSRERWVLPGRLQWQLRPGFSGSSPGWRLRLEQSCCMNGPVELWLGLTAGGLEARVVNDGAAPLAQWPAAWLAASGTPWNTLQPGGRLRLFARDLRLDLGWYAAAVTRVQGQVTLLVDSASSRLSTLPTLGSYRIAVEGQAGRGPDLTRVWLTTLEGPLLLQGEGALGPQGLRLQGLAEAAPERRAALDNLLNLVGRREGARSILSIGRS